MADLKVILEQLASVRGPTAERTRELRERYLALLLQSLAAAEAAPLPGRPPTWREIQARWASAPEIRMSGSLVLAQGRRREAASLDGSRPERVGVP